MAESAGKAAGRSGSFGSFTPDPALEEPSPGAAGRAGSSRESGNSGLGVPRRPSPARGTSDPGLLVRKRTPPSPSPRSTEDSPPLAPGRRISGPMSSGSLASGLSGSFGGRRHRSASEERASQVRSSSGAPEIASAGGDIVGNRVPNPGGESGLRGSGYDGHGRRESEASDGSGASPTNLAPNRNTSSQARSPPPSSFFPPPQSHVNDSGHFPPGPSTSSESIPTTRSEAGSSVSRSRPTSPPAPPADFNPAPYFPSYSNPISPVSLSPGHSAEISRSGSLQGSLASLTLLAFGEQSPHPERVTSNQRMTAYGSGNGDRVVFRARGPEDSQQIRRSGSSASGSGSSPRRDSTSSGSAGHSVDGAQHRSVRPASISGMPTIGTRQRERRDRSRPGSRERALEENHSSGPTMGGTQVGEAGGFTFPIGARREHIESRGSPGMPLSRNVPAQIMRRSSSARSGSMDMDHAGVIGARQETFPANPVDFVPIRPYHRQLESAVSSTGSYASSGASGASTIVSPGMDVDASHHLEEARTAINTELEVALHAVEGILSPSSGARRASRPISPIEGRISPRRSFSDGVASGSPTPRMVSPRRGLDRRETSPVGVHTLTTARISSNSDPVGPGMLLGLQDAVEVDANPFQQAMAPIRPSAVDDSRWGAVRSNRRSPTLGFGAGVSSSRVISSPLPDPGSRARSDNSRSSFSSDDARSTSPVDNASARLWDSVWPATDRGHIVMPMSPTIPIDAHEGTLPFHIRSLSTSTIATQSTVPRLLGTLAPTPPYQDHTPPSSNQGSLAFPPFTSQLTQALAATRGRERRGSLVVSHTWPPGRPFPQAGLTEGRESPNTFSSMGSDATTTLNRNHSDQASPSDPSENEAPQSPGKPGVAAGALDIPPSPSAAASLVCRADPAKDASVESADPDVESRIGFTQAETLAELRTTSSPDEEAPISRPVRSPTKVLTAGREPPQRMRGVFFSSSDAALTDPSVKPADDITPASQSSTLPPAKESLPKSVAAPMSFRPPDDLPPPLQGGTSFGDPHNGRTIANKHPGMYRSTSHMGPDARPVSTQTSTLRPRSYSGGRPAPSSNLLASMGQSPRAGHSGPGPESIGPIHPEPHENSLQSASSRRTEPDVASLTSSNSESSSGSSSGPLSGSSGEADDEASPPRATCIVDTDTLAPSRTSADDSFLADDDGPTVTATQPASPISEDPALRDDISLSIDEAMVTPTDAFPMEMAFEDEGLTTLERIFLLSKSEFAFHRAYIARMLGDLLEDVDPCETVEYVIPLLNGFAVDEDESVKEAFASDLHRIMWHFFSTCKIIDDTGEESPDLLPIRNLPATTPGQVVTITSKGIRTIRKPTLEGSALEATSRGLQGGLDGAAPSPHSALGSRSTTLSTSTATDSTPGTLSTPSTYVDTPTSTLSNQTTVSDATALSPAAEINALGTGGGEIVKNAGPLVNRPSIAVHIFTPMLGSMLLSQNSLVADPARTAVVSILAKLRGQDGPLAWRASDNAGQRRTYMSQSGVHQHDVYPFSKNAKRAVERELVTEIVLGIGRLDSDAAEEGIMYRPQSRLAGDGGDRFSTESGATSAPPESFGGDRPGMARTTSRSSAGAFGGDRPEGTGTDGSLTTSEAAMFKMQLAQEAMLGRAISMNLLASVAEFYTEQEIESYQFIPQVLLTAVDEPGVKTEAALALAYLAKHASAEAIDSLLELFESFAGDPIDQVRQAACLCLPALAKRIDNQAMKRDYVVEAYTNLVYSGDLVQYTSLEILGEIIHLFHDDPNGTPTDLLEVFLSQSSEHEELESFTAEIVAEEGPRTFSQYRREFDDLDRAAISAFNFPAVCLALGRAGWFQIRQTYRALCNINHPRVTRSLAGSIHEIAKIVGPDFAAGDLLEPFYEFLHGKDELQERVLQNIGSFLRSVPATDALDCVRLLVTDWETGLFRNWNHRELLAGQAAEIFGAQPVDEDFTGACFELLHCFLFDTYEAVRLAAVHQVPACHKAVLSDPKLTGSLLDALYELGSSKAFKHRRTFMTCLIAFLEQGIDMAFFEEHFMSYLTPLSDDLLDVRIGLAHLVSRLCSSGGLYADVVARSLALAEVIERLRNDESPYVRKPLESVHPKPMPMFQNPSGGWHGPLTDVFTPGQVSGTSSGGTPGGRRSSSASMILARAESDTTIIGMRLRSAPMDTPSSGQACGDFFGEGRTGEAQSAPASYRSPDLWYSPNRIQRRRRALHALSEHSQHGSTPEEIPVQVGMRDIFDASFSRAVQLRNADRGGGGQQDPGGSE